MTPAPASLLRLGPLSWTMATAFTHGKPLGRVRAIAALPAVALTLAIYLIARSVYETDDGDGMVIVGRHNPSAFFAAAVIIALVCSVAGGVLAGFGLLHVERVGVAAAVTVALLLISALALGGGIGTATGLETPRGRLYLVAALAQRPGTSMSALLLTRRLVQGLPHGSIVVAAAATDDLKDAYLRLGFQAGDARRVHLVIPDGTR